MAQCTAPVRGHRTASGREACPSCGGRSRSYSSRTYSPYRQSYTGTTNRSTFSDRNKKPKWSSPSSRVFYTTKEIRTLTPVREKVEARSNISDLRDVFLCHAWDDRKNEAKELHDLLGKKG